MSSLLDAIIGKRLTPEEMVKKWRASIRSQERELDKSIRGIQKEELKAKQLLKQSAKRNDQTSCKLLAKEIVASRKATNRIYTSKAQLNSLIMCMQQQLGNLEFYRAYIVSYTQSYGCSSKKWRCYEDC